MTKKTKLTCLLVGILVLATLAMSLISHEERAGGIYGLKDKLFLFFGLAEKKPRFSKCIDNLRRIQLSKVDWANESGKNTNDVPSWNDLRDYLSDQHIIGIPVCPSGGTYEIKRVGERPTCSIGGSVHSMQ